MCAEAAAVGYPHAIKGEGIYAYVILKQGVEPSKQVAQELKNKVRQDIGAFAAPDQIHFASGLPKTRSGKIMRRILRKIAAGSKDSADMGDISTLADPSGPPFPVVREASPMLDVVQSLGRRLSRSIRLST
jgi:acetyl-CoA synthetase